ncbi:huntingtin [Malaya genurostris]|uniref:huntingtin n=1 Tax=Malaya genurostris TaxID=325434 RepID=UPI0026F3CFE1|nr:huntingtin [Malaya genurostris]
MEKLSVFSSLQKSIDTLKSTECSQKEKIVHFGHISESLLAIKAGPLNANFTKHLSTAIATLLMFCEEIDSSVRMSAEENLNRIVRYCEGNGALVRIQIDLYHELKRNGNEKSLRICLGLFGHYCGAIKQRKCKTYAQNLLPCIYAISKRRETQVLESLANFVKVFVEQLESFLTDGEVLKMTMLFVEDLTADCATKRRCAAQNIDSFVVWSRCPEFYANNVFNRCVEILLKNQEQNAVLGVMACLRGILPIVLKNSSVERSVEIFDLVLHFLKDGSHSIINAALEVVSVILVNIPQAMGKLLLSNDLDHRRILFKRKTLKNSIFKINLSDSILSSRKSSTDARMDCLKPDRRPSLLQVTSTPTKFPSGDDKSLASASDLDMDSFRSMEFDQSLQLTEDPKPKPGEADTVSLKSQKSTDSLGSFINTFLTSSSNAGESVSKFFRKPFDSPASMASSRGDPSVLASAGDTSVKRQPEEDDLSLESLASSQISIQSSAVETLRNELDVTLEVDDSLVTTDSVSATLAEAAVDVEIRAETPTASLAGAMEDVDDPSESATRELFIGSIHDQNMLEYAVRLIASRFLLAGTRRSLVSDFTARVSVKTMALQIVAQCVLLRPELLLLPLEKDEPKDEFDVVEILNLEDAINEIAEQAILEMDEGAAEETTTAAAAAPAEDGTDGLLEMKEDHFGECTSSSYFEFFSPMSISLDQGLTSLKTKLKLVEENFSTMANDSQAKLSKELDAILSQSDCSAELGRKNERKKELLVVPKVITSRGDVVTRRLELDGRYEDQQMIADVLLFYDHSDQSLRGNVLLIVGNFLKAVLERNGNVEAFLRHHEKAAVLGSFLRQDAMLSMIVQGLSDEIHTVVNQALAAFDQTVTLYCRSQPYKWKPSATRQITSDSTFKPATKRNVLIDGCDPMDPQLLINHFLSVFDNKYWLVQCKVCEVIVKLDFKTLRNTLGREQAKIVQQKCLKQLISLLRDGDPRVRNFAGEKLMCLLETIYESDAKDDIAADDEGIVKAFIKDYVLVCFAEPIDCRKLRTPSDTQLFGAKLAPIFYVLSNQLLDVSDRNQLFGIINFLKLFITKYNPFDLLEIWNEFNLLNVLLSLMSEHTGTGLDLTAQNDLLEICSTLLIVIMSTRETFTTVDNELIDKFIFHLLKLMNIYQHLFGNVKPVVLSRAQKGDLFMNARELQLINCFGYFGADHFYLKLYSLLRSSFENWKITINGDVGQKLFELLRTSIVSLWRLLEEKSLSTMIHGYKFMEEVFRYLIVFLPYEPERCIQCTKRLLRFLFSNNSINRRRELAYFRGAGETLSLADQDGCLRFVESYREFCSYKCPNPIADLVNYVKLFEQIVVACLKIFSRASVRVQTVTLELLCDLLDCGINYQQLDSGNVFVDYVLKHVELLETGTIRDSEQLICKIVQFLFRLSSKERTKIVNIPKIINICDNLLANGLIRGVAIEALQVLAHEIFFLSRLPLQDQQNEVLLAEDATQKEVVLNMMIKFPENVCSYRIAPMVLMVGKYSQPGKYEAEILNALLGVMLEGKLLIKDNRNRLIVSQLLEALGKSVLLESKALQSFLKILFEVGKNKDLSAGHRMVYWQLILEKVILNAEESFLLSHVKLFLSKEPAFDENSCVESEFGRLLADMVMKSLESYDDQKGNCFARACLIRVIRVVTKFRKYPTISKCIVENIVPGQLIRLDYNDLEVRSAILDFLVQIGYAMKQLLDIVDDPTGSIRSEEIATDLIGSMIEHKFAQTPADVLLLIERRSSTLIDHYDAFLLSYISTSEHARAFVSSVTDRLECPTQCLKVLNLLEKSHINSLPLVLEQLTNLLTSQNIAIARKTALVLDSKLETVTKQQPLTNEYLKTILPDRLFKRLFDTLTPERRKKFPKLFKSLLSLVRFYKCIDPPHDLVPRIEYDRLKQLVVDEPWFMEQITYHCTAESYTKPRNIARMLHEVNSESKLITLLSGGNFNPRVLREVIVTAFETMAQTFRRDCVQFNPHLNYLKVHPMLKVALIVLMKKLDELNLVPEDELDETTNLHYVKSVNRFLENLNRLEHLSLIYVEARFIDRFVKDHLLKSNFFESLLIFARNCGKVIRSRVGLAGLKNTNSLELYLKCIDLTLKQRYLWAELNQNDKYGDDQDLYVCVVFDILKDHLQGRMLLKRYQSPEAFVEQIWQKYDQVEVYLQVALIAQYLSETEENPKNPLVRVLQSVAVSVLKLDRFYPLAMTPPDVLYSYSFEDDSAESLLRLPSVPIDFLYDLETLEGYLKRVNIFGYSSKQQFEELFMSLLVLINKDGNPDLINDQEQHEIKSMCLRAIIALLLSCYKYPRIGFADGKYYHDPRNTAFKCDSVGMKKLHSIQLLIPSNNVFYQPNLERSLRVPDVDERCPNGDSSIGTESFAMNQFSIRYAWHTMESVTNESLVAKNVHYFIEKANLDVRSSIQLLYDIFEQLLEDNFSLALPHLVPFCEICENRDQIRQLYGKVLGLQERIAMEDTLSQQHIIYLLCKMAALLVPSMAELTHLCTIIPTYLKSTQLYIRDATLSGVICLLECLVTSNTTIGGLSEELQLLRNIIVNYIVKHGIIDESFATFSDTHTKLVWALNFYLIENTSRFVTDCNLLSNSIISANNILKRTTNLEIYLCILNGLERLVLSGTTTRPLLEKIEKLALDLVKVDNEMFSLAALKLLLTCIYSSSAEQLENTERSNGIVQDEPEIIIQQIDKIEILFTKIRSTTPQGAKIFGDVLCQLIRDLLPPNEILTKVFKELMLNQPNPDIIANVTHQVFRSAIDSSYLALLQEWLLCSLPNFLSFPQINKSVWCLTVIFLSASLNQHLLKLFPEVLSLPSYQQLNEREIRNFILSAKDFYRRLEPAQRIKFKEIFQQTDGFVYQSLLRCL